jgi:Fe-S oxidoreductase
VTASNIILLVLVHLALILFLKKIFQFIKLTKAAQGTLCTDNPGKRIGFVLAKGFGQALVLKKASGLGHFVIFWGFILLTIGTAEGLMAGIIPGFSLDFLGPLYYLLNTLQDLLALCVVMAIIVSLFRRLVLKPKRLEGPVYQTVDALLVLGAILVLIAAFYCIRAIDVKPGFTPVANLLSNTLCAGMGHDPLFVFEWIHHSIILAFLVYIPYSKHTHIVAALFNLYFKDDRVKGKIEKLDLEDEKTESYGIGKISDYTKKDYIDLVACTECGRCQESCPAYDTGKPLSPKHVIQDLKSHLFRTGPALLKQPDKEPEKKLYSDVITPDVLWACTTCRACEEVCPVEIKPMSKLIGIRQNRVLMEGDLPEEAQTSLKNMEVQSNPWGLAQEERGKWAEATGIKTLSEDADVEYLFFVGCAGSYDQRAMEVSRAVVKILQHCKVKAGILGSEEICTGDSAKRIGNEYLAQQLAQQCVETLNKYQVKKVLTACPHCYNSLKNEFPDYGGSYQVLHTSEFIRQHIESGSIRMDSDKNGKTAFHDSCYLGRYNDIYDAPRYIIQSATGSAPEEMKDNREDSFCCGAGGGRMWMEEKLGTKINDQRTQQSIDTGASTVAVGCPYCLTMLTDGLKAHNREQVKVKDIAELVAESLA